MLEPLRDQNFRRYMVGISVISFAWAALFAFVPLYMKEQVGLSAANVLLLEAAMTVGGLLSSYL